MELPLQISFRGMRSSPALERRIWQKAKKLRQLHDRITSCHVVIEARTRHQDAGQLYRVRIELAGPGYEIVVGKTGRHDPAHTDVYVAVRDSFDAAARRLQDHVRVSRGEVKSHAVQNIEL